MPEQRELRLEIPDDLPDIDRLKDAYMAVPGGPHKRSFEEYLADPLLRGMLRRIVYRRRGERGH